MDPIWRLNPVWRERILVTWLGLGHLTFGACVMTLAITNAEQSIWSLPQFAFGGAIITQGVLHLTAVWNVAPAPAPPVLANGPDRVGIRLAPVEQGDPALVRPGLVLQQEPPLSREGMHQPMLGVVDQPVVEDVVQDAPVNDALPANIVQDVDVGQAGPANIVQDVDVGQAGPANIVQYVDVGQAGPANNIVRDVDVGQVGPANNIVQDVDHVAQAAPANDVVREVGQEGPANNVVQDDAEPGPGSSSRPRNMQEPINYPKIFIGNYPDCE